jgi:hypothetical protein
MGSSKISRQTTEPNFAKTTTARDVVDALFAPAK